MIVSYSDFFFDRTFGIPCVYVHIYASFSVQQSSFYGLTSMLPYRYTQAVMTGESKTYLETLRLK